MFFLLLNGDLIYPARLPSELSSPSTLSHSRLQWSLPLWSPVTLSTLPTHLGFSRRLTSLKVGLVPNVSCRWLAGKEWAFQFFLSPSAFNVCFTLVSTSNRHSKYTYLINDICSFRSLRKGTVENCQGNTVPVIFDGTSRSTLTSTRNCYSLHAWLFVWLEETQHNRCC